MLCMFELKKKSQLEQNSINFLSAFNTEEKVKFPNTPVYDLYKLSLLFTTENVDSGTPKKFHHQNAPEYLERRQRMRRKSGGNILSDILKPQRGRKNQKRNESESPRTVSTSFKGTGYTKNGRKSLDHTVLYLMINLCFPVGYPY